MPRARAPGRERVWRPVAALIGLAALALSAPALAEDADPQDALRTVEERLAAEKAAREDLAAKREALAEDLRRVRAQVIDSAEAVQDAEENLSALEDRLEALHAERDRIISTLSLRDDQIARVLTAIQRLAWRPTEALLVQPAPPADTVRGAILLRAAIPHIEERARVLSRDLDSLRGLDTAITAQRAEIAEETAALKVAHARLEALFDQKAALQRDTLEREREAARRVARLGQEAADLRDLVERLEAARFRRDSLDALRRGWEDRAQALESERQRQIAEAAAESDPAAPAEAPSAPPEAPLVQAAAPAPLPEPEPAPPRAFASGRGAMPMPARGRVVARYGEPDDVGGTSKGVTVRTRDGAQVVAPFDGTVAFSGPFRGYGLLLIIEHTDGYHSLLAGLSRLDAHVGQNLRAGEPVGVMGGDDPTLYIELRRDGRPINPLPWLAAGSDTGKG
ncbi:peptidoglycan DD-metalloendopeptidase family protein [uncultured Rhodospira sp.]|uniref:murein hydrolase activator EnvC family protein n=1 Tax=uncultured Rhodospira sp. TaxID=1936189 RepID=UPI00262918CE|nr:peptidoglycan DD-metalloendopeptidase family protein [uncultured Rhodospira sp.]